MVARAIVVVPDAAASGRSCSRAAGSTASSEDDLAVAVDLTPIFRERTLRALDLANDALARWRAAHPGEGIARDWPRARARLVVDGWLAADSETERDAWGRALEADRSAATAEHAAWTVVSPALLARGNSAR